MKKHTRFDQTLFQKQARQNQSLYLSWLEDLACSIWTGIFKDKAITSKQWIFLTTSWSSWPKKTKNVIGKKMKPLLGFKI
jgi:hypothetical protein